MKKPAKASKSKKRSTPVKKKATQKAAPAAARTKSLGGKYYAQSKRLAVRLIEAGDDDMYIQLFTDAKTVEHFMEPLTPERARDSHQYALTKSQESPWAHRISVVVERSKLTPLGIASIRMADTENLIAEVGILLKPSAAAQRYATEASQTLISSAFRRHTIAGIVAYVAAGHKIGERLVKTLGYDRGRDIPPSPGRGPRTEWTMSREKWANTYP